MDFELSDDQVALRDAAVQLLDGHASPAQVRAHLDGGGGCDPALWTAMLEQGWPALARPEADGGLGFGWVELTTLLEAVGSHVAPAPILQQVVALDVLQHADGAADVAAVIDRLSTGEAIGTVAWRPVSAAPDGAGGWLLTGTPEPIVFGPEAEVAVVVAHDATDPSGDGVVVGDDLVFLVELADLKLAPEPAMDLSRSLGWLRLDRTPALRLGGQELAERFLDAGALAYSAELLGASARALDLAVEHAKTREQFGRPIGSLPGDQAPLRGHARRHRGDALGGLLRRLVPGRGRRERLRGGIDREDVVLGCRQAGDGVRRCRCTGASGSRGSATSTSSSSAPRSTRSRSATPPSTVPASADCSPPASPPATR